MLRLPANEVMDALARVMHAVSDDKTRYYLCGVHVAPNPEGGGYDFVATDGARLCAVKVLGTVNGAAGAILPQATCKAVVAELRKLKAYQRATASVELDIQLSAGTIRWPGGVLEFAPIDGKFPDYRRVIPIEFRHSVISGRKELRKAIVAINGFGKGFVDRPVVKLTLAAGKMTLSTERENASASAWVKTRELEGEFEISFSSQHLLDWIKRLDLGSVQLRFSDAGSPALLCEIGNEAETYVLMPRR